MKKVVSVSLGSSRRDHRVVVNLLGEEVEIERRGTDGDMAAAIRMIRDLDGRVDAIGLGGIDLYVVAGDRRYVIRDARKLALAASRTPVVDGSGLKNTLERRVIRHLDASGAVRFKGKRVLMVSAVDRFGMAETLAELGADLVIGDLIFTLGIPVPLHSLRALSLVARVIAPIACQLPFQWLYPTGGRQEEVAGGRKYASLFGGADIVAGDFHFVRRYMPERLDGKGVITNTVTAADVDLLRARGVDTLVTTTPELGGRSFGTNVMEAALVAVSGMPAGSLTPGAYEDLLDRIGFRPRVERLQAASQDGTQAQGA